MDHIVIRGMQFFAFHGVLPEENRIGQRFLVHLKLTLPLHVAGQSDDVGDTVNYADVYHHVKQIVEGPPFRLIERLAEEIAVRLLSEFERIQGLVVEVEKPGAPIPGIFESVCVVLERTRQHLEGADRASAW